MRTISTSLFLLLMVFVGCSKRQTTQIADVTKSATLTLTVAPGQSASVHGFSLSIHGKIDGSAQISGTDLQTNHVSGKFKIRHDGDYYASNCVIEYVPVGVRSGQITIEYAFRCID